MGLIGPQGLIEIDTMSVQSRADVSRLDLLSEREHCKIIRGELLRFIIHVLYSMFVFGILTFVGY